MTNSPEPGAAPTPSAQGRLPDSGRTPAVRRPVMVGVPWVPVLLRLAVPAVLASLIQGALMFIEARELARVGTQALAAVAVVFPLLILTQMLSTGAIGGAISGATARSMGANDLQAAQGVLNAAWLLALAGGLLTGGLVLVAGPWFFGWLGARDEVLEAATTYSSSLFAGIALLWLFNMSAAVLRGSGDMLRPALCILLVVAAYAGIISAMLADVRPLLEAMQVAARSLLAAYAIGLVAVLWLIWRPSQPIRPRKLLRSDLAILRRVLRQGLMAGTQSLLTVTSAMVATAMLSRLGADWLAGYGLAVRLELLMVPLVFGIGGSLIALVGAHVGAGQMQRGLQIAWRGALFNAGLVGTIGLSLALWPAMWCGQVSSTAPVQAACMQTLQTMGPFYAFFALGQCLYFASQGLETLLWPVLGALLRFLIVAAAFIGVSMSIEPWSGAQMLRVLAGAMVCYGVFVAVGLKRGPWRRLARA